MFLPKILPQPNEDRKRAQAYINLIRYEAKLGGKLFGPIPVRHHREFFCLDKYTWVWHEEWTTAAGKRQIVATHYTMRPDGVLKSQNNQGYQKVGDAELRNLFQAIDLYGETIPTALQQLKTA
jgi:hypothetical protein